MKKRREPKIKNGVVQVSFFQKASVVDKTFFVQNLAVLIKAGFSLSHALETVSRQTRLPWFTDVMRAVARDVEAGQTFANALRKYEKVFDQLFINMIETGELSGKLEQTLRELAIQMKKSHSLYLKVRNALAYPAIILFALVGIGIGMMVFVIPKITALYKDTSYDLPTVTKIVIAFSDFVIANGLLTAGIVITIIIIFVVLQKQEPVKVQLHRLILHSPVFGGLIQEYNIARFARVFHSLISTDIPIIKAFDIITKTLKNRQYRICLQEGIPQLERGVGIGEVLGQDELLFPPTVVEMVKVAEKSGALDEMTGEIADHYEEEVSSALDGLSVLIEPILMLLLGIGVAFIAVAVLWPMYNLVNVIQ